MSYHRVLPVPEALIHPNPARKQKVGTDSLLPSRTMTSEKPVSPSKRSKSPVSSQQSSSPLVDKPQGSPSINSVDGFDDSPEPRDRSSSQLSNREVRRLPSISKSWQAESPSDICLCQPDPKVPRPRNGTPHIHMNAFFLHIVTMQAIVFTLIVYMSHSEVANISVYSIYPIPSALSGCSGSPKPRPS